MLAASIHDRLYERMSRDLSRKSSTLHGIFFQQQMGSLVKTNTGATSTDSEPFKRIFTKDNSGMQSDERQ